MNGFTGYDPTAVENLRSEIENDAVKVSETIIEKLHSGIIIPISSAWYTPEGKEYFEAFAETVKQTGATIEEAFNAFIQSVGSAANNWAENTKGQTVTLGNIKSLNMSLDVSQIQEKEGTKIGIKEQEATSVAGQLGTVRSDIQTELSTIAQGLDASSAFLGYDQGAAVTDCFEKVNNAVSKIFDFLTEGENSLQSQIRKAVEKYGDVAKATSDAFKNSSVE